LQTPVKEEEERRNNKYDSIIGWYYWPNFTIFTTRGHKLVHLCQQFTYHCKQCFSECWQHKKLIHCICTKDIFLHFLLQCTRWQSGCTDTIGYNIWKAGNSEQGLHLYLLLC
jgi:hypothetical protein